MANDSGTVAINPAGGQIEIKIGFYAGNFVQYEARVLRANSTILEKFKQGSSREPAAPDFFVPYKASDLVNGTISVICECIPTSPNEQFKVDITLRQDGSDLVTVTPSGPFSSSDWITGSIFLNSSAT